MPTSELRIKLWGDNVDAIRKITDDLLENNEGFCSPILRSNPQGFHSFLTLQVEVEAGWDE